MNVYLYGRNFEITDANICEARGKYLVRTSINNADKFIKSECEKCRSVSEMTQRIPQITGALILNVTQHILYTLRLEGVSTNAKNYLDSVFGASGSICQRVCQALNSRARELDNSPQFSEIADKLTAAVVMDLQNLWTGYFHAHGYSAQEEFYTHQKLNHAIRELAVLSVSRAVSAPAEICVQALRDAPYDESIYKTVEERMGADKNLAAYKNLFVKLFKAGSYKDLPNPRALDRLKSELVKKVHDLCNTPEFKFKSHVYSSGGTTEKGIKKFNTAVATYAPLEKNEFPLLCVDATAMGGAEDGAIISTRGIYMHTGKDAPKFFHFNDIKTLTVEGLMSKNIFVNGQKMDTGGMSNSDVKRFHALINKIRELIAPLHEGEKKSAPTKADIEKFTATLRADPNFNFDSCTYFYGTDDKSNKKFKDATASYAKLDVDEYPIVCNDATVFGSADEGFVVTNFGIHIRNMGEDAVFFAHKEIRRLELCKKEIYVNNKKLGIYGSQDKQRLLDLIKRIRDYCIHF